MATETQTFSFNKGDTNDFEREVSHIEVAFGKLFVTGNGVDEVVADSLDLDNSPAVSIYAAEATNFSVTFADNAVRPVFQNATAGGQTVRGDAGGQTGSYESRTVEELHEVAKERGVKGYYDLKKEELIARLRG